MDNKMLLLGALALGIYMMSGSGAEQRYFVPGTGYVPESQLPSLGYVKVDGKWYSQAQVDAAAAQAGVSAGTVQPGTNAWTVIAQILSASVPLITTIGNYASGGSDGGGSMAGVFGPSPTICHRAGYNLATKGRSIDGKTLAMCRWKQ